MIRKRPGSSETVAVVKVLIVDDHPIVRQGLAGLINQEPDLTVCGEAADSKQALQAIKALTPDFAIVDISLPGVEGFELVKSMLSRNPELPILVLSMNDETLYAERALKAGAKGYIMKAQGAQNLITAIRRVLDDDIYISDKIAKRILRNFATGKNNELSSSTDLLSDREVEVLTFIGKGYGTRQIAETLHLSAKTIETYRAHIKDKLQLANSSEVIQYAIQWVHRVKTA